MRISERKVTFFLWILQRGNELLLLFLSFMYKRNKLKNIILWLILMK